MIALVTGGAGFIGSHLCERLLTAGHQVRCLDNFSTGRQSNIATLQNNPAFSLFEGDIRDAESLEEAFNGGVDWVFHLAGLADIVPSIESPETYFEVNVQGTLNVLQQSRRAGVKRLVYAASSSSYGFPEKFPTPEESPIDPQYPYALTKYMGEELVLHWAKVYNMPAMSLRLFNVYGTRSRTTGAYGAVFGVFLAQKLNGKPYTVVGDGEQTRDFTYVTDVASAFHAAAESGIVGEALNVGSGDHQSINRLVQLLGGEITYIPKRPGEPDCTFADTTKILAKLDWRPTISFEEGVGKMLAAIEDWRDAPLWEPASIAKATKTWFDCLGDDEQAQSTAGDAS
ncbi:SDR family oxidoreductase [Magnetofaba australis]|uniref:Putative NAD-dependent epimerase/dehydratase n=1 Tax=Magnetofaba australis IT-1 TaxID=1434232 RepID=A0A1Y2K4N9_9PROT|nr:SDR family oxidoreductase [Magnetofaba australis]OSM04219.1 putative NAD-dependent epimerase/dehydratase [Magnetofaba australis IT-1]